MTSATRPTRSTGTSTPVAMFSMGLTPDERATLKEIAARERVTMASIVRELLSREFPEFRKVCRDPLPPSP